MITHLPPKPAIVTSWGIVAKRPPLPRGCTVTYTRLTLAAREAGIGSIVTYWCHKPR